MLTETPSSSLVCPWCGGGVSVGTAVCPECFMPVKEAASPTTSSSPPTSKPPAKKRTSPKVPHKTREEWVQEIQESYKAGDTIVVGIDPGARYIGFCIRNDHGRIFVSSTFRRTDEMPDSVEWAKEVVRRIAQELEDIDYQVMGIEGVADPKGFKNGKRDALNPKDIIRTGIVVGALVVTYPDAYVVRPRSNGSKDKSEYPSCLLDRRPNDLGGVKDPGVTVRDHERSAYDVTNHALFAHVQSK